MRSAALLQVCVLAAMGVLVLGQSGACTQPGNRCDGEGAWCCACADGTSPACIIFNGIGQRDDYSLCECKSDTCESSGGSCVKNCGNGQQSNCRTACEAHSIPFVDNSQCNAAQGGGWKCPGVDVCCHCNAPSSVLPIKVSVKMSAQAEISSM